MGEVRSQPRTPAQKAGVLDSRIGCGREMDCLLEGDGSEFSVSRLGWSVVQLAAHDAV
jgi:hypothetical protein